MTDVSRLAPLAGIIAVVLVVAGSVTIGFYTYLPAQDEIRTFLQDNASRVRWGAYIIGLAGFFLLVFAGSVWNHLRDKGSSPALPAIAALGAVAAAGLIIVDAVMMIAAGDRAGTDAGIGGGAAVLVYDLSAAVMGSGAPVAFAALVAGFTAVSFASRILPVWLNWVSVLLVIALLSPFSFIALAVGFLWIVIVSVVMHRDQQA